MKLLCKILNIAVALIFLLNTIAYGIEISPSPKTLLAPHSVFQKSFPEENSDEFRKSPLSDMRLLTMVFSVASYFLVDEKDKKIRKSPGLALHMEKTLRDEYRNDPRMLNILDGIDLENIERELVVVSGKEECVLNIPFEKNDKKYKARICKRGVFNYLPDKEKSDYGLSPNYAIHIVPLKTQIRSEENEIIVEFKNSMQGLLDKNEDILWVSDMDGALTPSRERISQETGDYLLELLSKEPFVIVTGNDFKSADKQILSELIYSAERRNKEKVLENLIVAANNASEVYVYSIRRHNFIRVFAIDLKRELGGRYKKAINLLRRCVREKEVEKTVKSIMGWDSMRGDPVGERGSQITFHVLGKDATPAERLDFGRKGSAGIRKPYKEFLNDEFTVRAIPLEASVSGSSSIDITLRGADKGFGIKVITDLIGIIKSLREDNKRQDVPVLLRDMLKGKKIKDIYEILQGLQRGKKPARPTIVFSGGSLSPGESNHPAIDKSDVIVNVGARSDLVMSKPYFALKEEGPESLNKFLAAYIAVKYPIIVSASLLSVPDPRDFARKAAEAIEAGADMVHFDVVEGKKGKTAILEEGSIDTREGFTPERLREIKEYGKERDLDIPIDVHLVVMEPSEKYLKSFVDAGADIILIHWEAFADKGTLLGRLKFLKEQGIKAGIVLRPDADIEEVGNFVAGVAGEYIDMISQAGIYPCYEGQIFAYNVLENIRILRQKFEFEGLLAVDGGVETEISSPKAVDAGADFVVAGSAFFGNGQRSAEAMAIAAKNLKNREATGADDIFDIIANRILELREKKKGKLWIRISGYSSSGKSVFTREIIRRLERKRKDLSVIDFAQDDFWTDREERARRKLEDPTYADGLTHLRVGELEKAIEKMSKAQGPVTFDNIYDFDSGDIDAVKTHEVKEDSVMFLEGCYTDAISAEFDLSLFIKTDLEKAKERGMVRDEIRVHRKPEDTKELYEKIYEPTYAAYLERFRPEENADIIVSTENIEIPVIVYAKPALKLLECTVCHKQLPAETRITRCPACGGDLEFDIKGKVDFQSSIVCEDKSMWRYRKLLPVDEKSIVTAGEGNTPVIRMEELGKKLGIELYAKLECENPTGTFKDREGSFVVSRSKELGQNDLVMQSTGNTGMAITYYAGLGGLRSYFFGPLLSQYKLLIPEKENDAKVILIDGSPADVKAVATDFALVHGFPKISPFYERCEANTTQGYEIAEKILNGELPNFDFYVQTVAAGMGPIGFFSGINRVSKWTGGKVKFPRVVAVQISEFAPVQEAWDEDREQVGPEGLTPTFASDHPYEPTLHTTNAPAYYPYLRKLLKSTDGVLTKVEPEEVESRMRELKDALAEHGVELTETENSSYVGYAGLIQQVENGTIPKGSKVIIMVTGKGEKPYKKAEPDAVITLTHDPVKLLHELRRNKPASRDMKGKNAPASDYVIQNLLVDPKEDMLEISLEGDRLRAYKIRHVDRYEPGKTPLQDYRNRKEGDDKQLEEEADISLLFPESQIELIKKWIREHPVKEKSEDSTRGPFVRFRLLMGKGSLLWTDDAEHSNISHAARRDKTVYMGELLFRHVFTDRNEALRGEILDNDELLHLRDIDHGPDDLASRARLIALVGPKVKKLEQISCAMLTDDWKFLLKELKEGLQKPNESRLINLFEMCETASLSQPQAPIESRYPILRAVTLLSKEEQEKLVEILNQRRNCDLRWQLAVVDSILLILGKDIPKIWLSKWAPHLIGRSLWQVASEIWAPVGGLGRVMQFHGVEINEFLKLGGGRLRHLEPYYGYRLGTADGKTVLLPMEYSSLTIPITDFRLVVEPFDVKLGRNHGRAYGFTARNPFGVETNLIRGDRVTDGGVDEYYYTKMAYNYGSPFNPAVWEGFSPFFSRAALDFIHQREMSERDKAPNSWLPPIIHTNDAQVALFDFFVKEAYQTDPILGYSAIAFSTHTFFHRQIYDRETGEKILRDEWDIPEECRSDYFEHMADGWVPVFDVTSAGSRTADWAGGVSRQHVSQVSKYDRHMGVNLIAVTNGDLRYFTAKRFREIMIGKFPDADVENPTPEEVIETKREAKKRLGLDPDKYVVSYSGRLVPEKAGRKRALTDKNIEELVKIGTQVVIYGNLQAGDRKSLKLEEDLKMLQKRLDKKDYPGKLIFKDNFTLDEQQRLLAAKDIQVQDSDKNTEAAGFSESGISSCCGLQMAPPWCEGILQAQGITINFSTPGEGNTLTPLLVKHLFPEVNIESAADEELAEMYLATFKLALSKTPEELAPYYATSGRLSRVIDARLTAAEYLRQFNRVVAKKEAEKQAALMHDISGLSSLGQASIGANFDEVKSTVDAFVEMGIIHEMNKNLIPGVEKGKILYHAIHEGLIPISIRSQFQKLLIDIERDYPKLREKITLVNDKNLLDEIGRITKEGNVVNVALPGEENLQKIPQGVRALVFTGEQKALSFRHIEGIIAALRALHQENAAALIELYQILTGKSFTHAESEILKNIDNPEALAGVLLFTLKPITAANIDDLKRLNSALLQLLYSA